MDTSGGVGGPSEPRDGPGPCQREGGISRGLGGEGAGGEMPRREQRGTKGSGSKV